MTLEDLYRLLRGGHVQAQGVVDTISEPLVVLDEHLCVLSANPAFYRLFRSSYDDTIGQYLLKLGAGQWYSPELARLLADVIPRSAAVVGFEVTTEFPKLGRRTMLLTARRLVHPDNNSLQMLVVFEDITDQRAHDIAQDLLIGELRHRFKNLLAVARAMARQMTVTGVSAEDFRDTFLDRLENLVESELLLFRPGDTTLANLLAMGFRPYGERVVIVPGPDVRLTNTLAVPLGMILHELATNAAKHGSLSKAEGRVHVSWSVSEGDSPTLVIDWREEGGPSTETPEHNGFGLKLMQFAIFKDSGGSIDLDFALQGLHARLVVPLIPIGA